MKFIHPSGLLALILMLSGCARMKVTTEQVQAFDFTAVQSYGWIDGPEDILSEADTYINDDFKTALDLELQKRGLRLIAKDGTPDIQTAYYLKLREEAEYTTTGREDEPAFSGGFVYSRDKGGWDYAEREPDINVYSIEIGTLTLLVYEADTSALVWRGNLQTRIDRSRPKEDREKLIRDAAEKLISRLP